MSGVGLVRGSRPQLRPRLYLQLKPGSLNHTYHQQIISKEIKYELNIFWARGYICWRVCFTQLMKNTEGNIAIIDKGYQCICADV